MPFISRKDKLQLSKEESEKINKIAKTRTEKKSKIERAKMISDYNYGKTISEIARGLHTNRPKVERCINKALSFGIEAALEDLPGKGKKQTIDMDARTYFLSIACTKPKELGFASEHWTMGTLAKYIRDNCEKAGYPSLKKLARGTASKILNRSNIKPHKTSYYLEKKDPDFDVKMQEVLHVYKEVEIYKESQSEEYVAVLSYDEKPGIQALGNVSIDLPPSPNKYSTWAKDYEYKRHGTLSLLASIDLISGKVYGKVFDKHRSSEFVDFLKGLNQEYASDKPIKIILDNHSAHISKETMRYLSSVPSRFKFVFTPVHASWLNIIEMFFSKMARTFLRGIRVSSKQELKNRILQYIEEINQTPVVFTWRWKMNEVTL